MDKSNKKSTAKWNTEVLNALAKKYDFHSRYIKQMITGERTPIFADRIKAEYIAMEKEVKSILNNNKI